MIKKEVARQLGQIEQHTEKFRAIAREIQARVPVFGRFLVGMEAQKHNPARQQVVDADDVAFAR